MRDSNPSLPPWWLDLITTLLWPLVTYYTSIRINCSTFPWILYVVYLKYLGSFPRIFTLIFYYYHVISYIFVPNLPMSPALECKTSLHTTLAPPIPSGIPLTFLIQHCQYIRSTNCCGTQQNGRGSDVRNRSTHIATERALTSRPPDGHELQPSSQEVTPLQVKRGRIPLEDNGQPTQWTHPPLTCIFLAPIIFTVRK